MWNFWQKCKFFTFRKGLFGIFPKNSFHASLWAFSKLFLAWTSLRLKIPTNKKFQPKWVITVSGGGIFGWNEWTGSRHFWMTSSGLEKNKGVVNIFLVKETRAKIRIFRALDWLSSVSGWVGKLWPKTIS